MRKPSQRKPRNLEMIANCGCGCKNLNMIKLYRPKYTYTRVHVNLVKSKYEL